MSLRALWNVVSLIAQMDGWLIGSHPFSQPTALYVCRIKISERVKNSETCRPH